MTTELSTHVGAGLAWDDTGKLINADFGSASGTICEGDDARLSDARDPNAHAADHLPSGGDPIATAAAAANPPGTASAEGSAESLARSDHTHALAAFGTGSGTFCEGNDSRLSDARTPTAHASSHLPSGGDPLTTAAAGAITPGDSAAAGSAESFARSDHQHSIAAFGTGSGTFAEGNDSRLSDDRTASGLRSASTVVSVSSATAPSAGQVLMATSSTAATWQAPYFPTHQFFADQLDNPVTSDWAVNSLAAASACSNNSALTVRKFANATENGVGMSVLIPAGATNIVLGFVSRAETATGSTQAVIPRVYVREFPDNASVEAWDAGTDLTAVSIPNSELWQYDSQSIALSTLSLVAGRVVQIELTRRGSDGSDTLTTDWTLMMCSVGFT